MANVVFSADFSKESDVFSLHATFESLSEFPRNEVAQSFGLLLDGIETGFKISELMKDPEASLRREVCFTIQVWDRFGDNLNRFVKKVLKKNGFDGLRVVGLSE